MVDDQKIKAILEWKKTENDQGAKGHSLDWRAIIASLCGTLPKSPSHYRTS